MKFSIVSPSAYCLRRTCDISQGRRTLDGLSRIQADVHNGSLDFLLPVALTQRFRLSVIFHIISLILPLATLMMSKIWIVE